jgi:diadenosine tetraphosphate (Ap4A) HIT family hydrolase
MEWTRAPLDAEGHRQEATGPCRLAEMEPPSREVVFRDERHLVFLNRYPTLEGYVLVAPVKHREQVVGDFTLEEYLLLQTLIFRIGRAMSMTVPTERLYLLSLGSQQGNRHVHWHVAALPHGTAFEDQQLAALATEHRGYLRIPEQDRDEFAARLRAAMERSDLQ